MRLIRFRRLAAADRLYVADDFIDASEIAHLRCRGARGAEQPAERQSAKHDETGYSFEMMVAGDVVLSGVSARLNAAFGFANGGGGSMRYRHYRVGESHPLHFDNYEIAGAYLVATAMLWLTAPEAGGETRFPNLAPPILLEPRPGRLAVWLNYDAKGAIEQAVMHDALPVVRGDKITLTSFIYGAIDAVPAFCAGLPGEADIPGIRRLAPAV